MKTREHSTDGFGMNQLYFGDNLGVMRENVKDESVDLIYLDPPFNSKRDYNLLFKSPKGAKSEAQVTAFLDSWHWTEQAELEHDELLHQPNTEVAEMMRALRAFLGENDMMAYLTMMAIRLLEMHRVLKPTGSLYLHCDPTASHFLRLVLDAVFEPGMFRNEITWKRTSAHSGAKRWGPIHDTILFYAKSERYCWNPTFQSHEEQYLEDFFKLEDAKGRYQLGDLTGAGERRGDSGEPWRGINPTAKGRHWAVPGTLLRELIADPSKLSSQEKLDELDAAGLISWPPKGGMPRVKRYLAATVGVAIQDVITDINPISAHAAERLGYPTQKPLALLKRIVSVSSNPGDLVFDPFCGCGTAVHAAQKLNRNWIGIDITHLAIALIEKRLKDAFGKNCPFEVHGTPRDLDAARDLAARNKFNSNGGPSRSWTPSLFRERRKAPIPVSTASSSSTTWKGTQRKLSSA
jgi:DNA modification methylase